MYEISIEQAEGYLGKLLITPLKTSQDSVRAFLSDFQANPQEWILSVSKRRKKRSLDANAYLWVLCDKIADKLKSTKEEIYQKAIREVGVFQLLLVEDKAADELIKKWNASGLGNFAEIAYKSRKNPECSAVIVYFGSSSYDTKEMSRVIDYIVEEAKGLGIDVSTPDDIERMKSLWR